MSIIFEGIGRALMSEQLKMVFLIIVGAVGYLIAVGIIMWIGHKTNLVTRFVVMGIPIAIGLVMLYNYCGDTIKDKKEFIVGAVVLGLVLDILIDVFFYRMKKWH